MKTNRLLKIILFSALSLSLFSCKKDDSYASISAAEIETTFDLSGHQAVADNLTEDANNVFMEAAANKNLLGNNQGILPVITSNNLTGAVVTVTPATGFPKTICIDFANGGTAANGITRKGKINIQLSDSVRKTGSRAIITFSNYYVNSFKKEGTVTWINTSNATTKSWQRKVENGKVVAANGRYWLHSGLKEVVQIAGAPTPNNMLDDIFLITGNHTITNAQGKARDCHITEALQKKVTCDNIGTGKLKVAGAHHDAIINFGDGDCDKIATISIDGQAPRTIVLR